MEITVKDEYDLNSTVTATEEGTGCYSLTYENHPAGILAIEKDNYEYHGELLNEVIEQVVSYLTNH